MADPIFGVSGPKTLPKADPAATNVLDNTPDVNLPDVTEGVDLKTNAITTWFGKLISELAPAVVSQEEQEQLADIAQNGESPQKEAASSQLNASYAVNAFASPFVRLVIVTYITIIILQILKRIPGVSGVPSMSDIADKLFNGKSYDWTDELEVNGAFLLNTELKIGQTVLKENASNITYFNYIPSAEIQEKDFGDKPQNYKPYPQYGKFKTKSGWLTKVPTFPEVLLKNLSVSAKFITNAFKASGDTRYYFKFIRGKRAYLQYNFGRYEIEPDSQLLPGESSALELNLDGSPKTKSKGRQLDFELGFKTKKGKTEQWVNCVGFAKDAPEIYAESFFNESNDRSLYFVKPAEYNTEDGRIELRDRLQLVDLKFDNGAILHGYIEDDLAKDEKWSSLLLSSDGDSTDYWLDGDDFRLRPKNMPSSVGTYYGHAYTVNQKNVFFYTKVDVNGDPTYPDGITDGDIDHDYFDSFLYVAKIMYKKFHRIDEKFPPMIDEGEYNSFYADEVEIWGYRYVSTDATDSGKHIKKLNAYCVSVKNIDGQESIGEFKLKSSSQAFWPNFEAFDTYDDFSRYFYDPINTYIIPQLEAVDPAQLPDPEQTYYDICSEFCSRTTPEPSPDPGDPPTVLFLVEQYRVLDDRMKALYDSVRSISYTIQRAYINVQHGATWTALYNRTIRDLKQLVVDYPDIADYIWMVYNTSTPNSTCLLTDGQYSAVDEGQIGRITVRKIENMDIDTFISRCENSNATNETLDFDSVFSDQTITDPESIHDVIAKFDDDSDYPLNRKETGGSDSHVGWLGSYTTKIKHFPGGEEDPNYLYSASIKAPFVQFEGGKATVKNKVEMNKAVPDAEPHFFQDAPEMVFEAKDPCTQPQSAMDRKMAMLLENDADQFTVMAAFGCCYTDDLWDKFQELKKLRRHMVRN